MTHYRFTNNTRPMDYRTLRRKPPVWRSPAGLGSIAVALVVGVMLALVLT